MLPSSDGSNFDLVISREIQSLKIHKPDYFCFFLFSPFSPRLTVKLYCFWFLKSKILKASGHEVNAATTASIPTAQVGESSVKAQKKTVVITFPRRP